MIRGRNRTPLGREIYESSEEGRDALEQARRRKFDDARTGVKGQGDPGTRSDPEATLKPLAEVTRERARTSRTGEEKPSRLFYAQDSLEDEWARLSPEQRARVIAAAKNSYSRLDYGRPDLFEGLSDILSLDARAALGRDSLGSRWEWLERHQQEPLPPRPKPAPKVTLGRDKARPAFESDVVSVDIVDESLLDQEPQSEAPSETITDRRKSLMDALLKRRTP